MFDAPVRCCFQEMVQYNGFYGCPVCMGRVRLSKLGKRDQHTLIHSIFQVLLAMSSSVLIKELLNMQEKLTGRHLQENPGLQTMKLKEQLGLCSFLNLTLLKE